MNTQTLRERFEKKHPRDDINKDIFYDKRRNAYVIANHDFFSGTEPTVIGYNNLWIGYQSSAEDNQCAVDLPSKDRRSNQFETDSVLYYAKGFNSAIDQCKAAIEASGARVK